MSIELLIERANGLKRVSKASADAYFHARNDLLTVVDEKILNHPDIGTFLGDNPFSLLETNHRNHVSFMAEVMASGDYGQLARVLPWVYRAYGNQGVGFDYFPAELNAWISAIKARLEPAEAEEVIQIYRWILDEHDAVIALSSEEDSNNACTSEQWRPVQQEFAAALKVKDHTACLAICRQAKELGASLPDLLEQVVYPTMVEVGLRWERGEIGVAGEHEATAIVNKVISVLYFEAEMPPVTEGRAVVSAAPSERHEMGAWMTATCLELDGWDVVYLGADLPADEIVNAVHGHDAQLLALSVAMPFNIDPTRKLIQQLRQSKQTREVTIMVGGQVFQRFPSLAEQIDTDVCLPDCKSAVDWARNWLNEQAH